MFNAEGVVGGLAPRDASDDELLRRRDLAEVARLAVIPFKTEFDGAGKSLARFDVKTDPEGHAAAKAVRFTAEQNYHRAEMRCYIAYMQSLKAGGAQDNYRKWAHRASNACELEHLKMRVVGLPTSVIMCCMTTSATGKKGFVSFCHIEGSKELSSSSSLNQPDDPLTLLVKGVMLDPSTFRRPTAGATKHETIIKAYLRLCRDSNHLSASECDRLVDLYPELVPKVRKRMVGARDAPCLCAAGPTWVYNLVRDLCG